MFKTLFPLSLVFTIFFTSCQKDTTDPNPVPPPESMYFPPTSGTEWQTTTAASLGWNEALIPDLYTYLQSKGTKGFIVLKNGKIVIEKYFGTFTADSNWYWASAGKTATAFLVGIAQQEGIINIPGTSVADAATSSNLNIPIFAIDSYTGNSTGGNAIHRVNPNGTATNNVGITSNNTIGTNVLRHKIGL